MTVDNQQIQQPALEETVERLLTLINQLFPEPSPDLFTLEDFRYRFQRFHKRGLVAAAIQSIERSQRINRRSGKYKRAGLSEFHIGLIYLEVGEFRGASQQFVKAQQQWAFVNEPAATALANVAEGVALHLSHHYEAAMACYSKANQMLPRMRFSMPAHFKNKVYEALSEQVENYQSMLHNLLWPADEEEEVEDVTAVPPQPPTPEPITQSITPTPAQPTPVFAEESPPPQEQEPQQDSIVAAPPIVNYETHTTPIPGHQYLGELYEWFSIDKQPESDFFPLDVQQGGWLLVDKSPALRQSGELVLVKRQEKFHNLDINLITVSPVRPFTAPRLYLAWLDKTSLKHNEPQFHIIISPYLEKISIVIEDIIGTVAGFWLPVQIDVKNQKSIVNFNLEKDYDRFSIEEQNQFVENLSRKLNIHPDNVCILHIASGSVIVSLEMPEEAALRLVSMFLAENSELKSLPITKVEITRDLPIQVEMPNIQNNEQNIISPTIVKEIKLAKLRQFTANYFNESDLKDICFDESIDYADLPGVGRRDKARELVAYFKRTGQLKEFVSICCQLRPNIPVLNFIT